ncbi:MAG TPA: response regulator transcription factor [Thermoanaerobaculia bacterium]|nr:response regulator transcription factor [Thermoanaerobaculia bacterium]
MPKTILIAEDEHEIAELVGLHLSDLGCEVTIAGDGETALTEALSKPFDLVVLDLMLPKLDGLEVCRRLRAAERYTPILMLTARSSELDRVVGLEVGADDYLTKPFSIRELVARVKAIFRRVEALGEGNGHGGGERPIRVGELEVDARRRRVTMGGDEVHLTAKEFDLLALFASRPGRVFTRGELLEQVWGYGYDGYEHTVNSHINRLRSKIEEDPANPTWVLTVWGVGYRFRDRDPEDGHA